MNKLAEQLQDNEIKVLEVLKKEKSLRIDTISSVTRMQSVEVGRAAMYLENKKILVTGSAGFIP